MPLRRRRILLLDHDVDFGRCFAALLSADGRDDVTLSHSVVEARQALEAVGARFDLVVTELDLADGDGDGLTVLLSALKLDPVPLIALVSSAGAELLAPLQDMVLQGSGLPLSLLSKPLVPALVQSMLQKMRVARPEVMDEESELSLEQIKRAIEQREFQIVLESQVDLETGVVQGFEALARWQHPDRGLLGPQHFIPLIESSALMPAFTLAIFDSLLLTRRHLAAHGYQGSLSLNLSPLCLADERFASEMIARSAQAGDLPGHYILELTETASAEDSMMAVASLARLRMHGFRLSVDDFGMGYASMLKMQSAAFSQIKIDRQFTSRVESERVSRAAVEAAVVVARNLGWTCVAEGIETGAQLTQLRRLGCGLGQGYLFSRPLPPEQAAIWWRSWMQHPAEALGTLSVPDTVAAVRIPQAVTSMPAPVPDLAALEQRRNAVWIFDLQNFGVAWANEAGIRFWRANSLQELLERDFVSDMSLATQDRLTAYRTLLIEQGARQERWTLYPKGLPQSVDCIVSPVNFPERGIAMQIEAFPVGAVMASDRLDMEIARMSASAILVFDLSGEMVWQSPSAYSLFQRQLIHLRDALASEAETEPLLGRARGDRQFVQDLPLLIGDAAVWCRLQMRQGRSPNTGEAIVICNLTPVDDLLSSRQFSSAAA